MTNSYVIEGEFSKKANKDYQEISFLCLKVPVSYEEDMLT